jgi:hypothetical protein
VRNGPKPIPAKAFVEYVTCSTHLCTRYIRWRLSNLRWVHFGKLIGVTKSFAGSSPGNGGDDGDDGPAHILVLAAQRHDLPVFDPMSTNGKDRT